MGRGWKRGPRSWLGTEQLFIPCKVGTCAPRWVQPQASVSREARTGAACEPREPKQNEGKG